MIDNKIKGHILNILSSSSLRPTWTSYQISKMGCKKTKLADTFIKYGIVVNAIVLGSTATPMSDVKDTDAISIPKNRYANRSSKSGCFYG